VGHGPVRSRSLLRLRAVARRLQPGGGEPAQGRDRVLELRHDRVAPGTRGRCATPIRDAVSGMRCTSIARSSAECSTASSTTPRTRRSIHRTRGATPRTRSTRSTPTSGRCASGSCCVGRTSRSSAMSGGSIARRVCTWSTTRSSTSSRTGRSSCCWDQRTGDRRPLLASQAPPQRPPRRPPRAAVLPRARAPRVLRLRPAGDAEHVRALRAGAADRAHVRHCPDRPRRRRAGGHRRRPRPRTRSARAAHRVRVRAQRAPRD